MKISSRALMVTLALTAPITAQFEDPREKISDIATKIAEEMKEIDRLLLQTSKKTDGAEAAAAMKRNVERIDELLKQTSESQRSAVQRIDELIKELAKMSGSGGGGSNQGSQSGRSQQRSQREESETPDLSQNNQPDGQQPQGNQDQRQPGENLPSPRPADDPTETVDRTKVQEKWGHLPDYMEFLKTRGGQPDVPEKYRKFRDAFLKQSQASQREK